MESVLTPNGPRQGTICSLGDLVPGSREEWVRRTRKLKHAVAGQEDLLKPSDPEAERVVENAKAKHAGDERCEHITVDPKLINVERHREAGTVHVG